jgi:hypothetical protein
MLEGNASAARRDPSPILGSRKPATSGGRQAQSRRWKAGYFG